MNMRQHAIKYGLYYQTVVNHFKQGYCSWPRRTKPRTGITEHYLYGTWKWKIYTQFGSFKEMIMNVVDSKCYRCGTRILVNQAEVKDPAAHVCMQCSSMDSDDSELYSQLSDSLKQAAGVDPDDEFDFETEEEEELINPRIQWDVDMAAEEYIQRLNDKPKCCCGAEAVGSKLHSDWCDIVKEK